MLPAQLIDAEARTRLEQAVRAAEQGTCGEIVVAVTRACDDYPGAPWRLGVTLAALVFLALALFAPPLPLWSYLLAQVVALLLAHALVRFDSLLRILLPRELLERRVEARARQAFCENGLQRTAGRSGILIFVAMLEHRVVVLGDEGIDSVLDPDESWTGVVALAVDGLREGRSVQGLEAAITRCGEILRHHFPPSIQPEPNELSDHIVLLDE